MEKAGGGQLLLSPSPGSQTVSLSLESAPTPLLSYLPEGPGDQAQKSTSGEGGGRVFRGTVFGAWCSVARCLVACCVVAQCSPGAAVTREQLVVLGAEGSVSCQGLLLLSGTIAAAPEVLGCRKGTDSAVGRQCSPES